MDPLAILRVLNRHDVHFLVIGGIAGALHGSATLTADVDILYERERTNVRRLADALVELGATRRDASNALPAALDARALLNGTNFLLTTRAGELDCIGETPSGRFTYTQLAPTAESFEIASDLIVAVVSLEDLISMKRTTGRPKDLAEVENLIVLRRVRDAE